VGAGDAVDALDAFLAQGFGHCLASVHGSSRAHGTRVLPKLSAVSRQPSALSVKLQASSNPLQLAACSL
jgi:hypothetical protein